MGVLSLRAPGKRLEWDSESEGQETRRSSTPLCIPTIAQVEFVAIVRESAMRFAILGMMFVIACLSADDVRG